MHSAVYTAHTRPCNGIHGRCTRIHVYTAVYTALYGPCTRPGYTARLTAVIGRVHGTYTFLRHKYRYISVHGRYTADNSHVHVRERAVYMARVSGCVTAVFGGEHGAYTAV